MPVTNKLNKMSNNNSTKGIYNKNILTRKIYLSINEIGSNLKENIEKKLQETIEGKCNVEGYIKQNTVNVLEYSSGEVKGDKIIFYINFECLVCKPVEGTILKDCIVKNNTKAGIRAELKNEKPSPLVIFVSRDHNYKNEKLSKLNENDIINVRLIGIRYELNDVNICAIGELVN